MGIVAALDERVHVLKPSCYARLSMRLMTAPRNITYNWGYQGVS